MVGTDGAPLEVKIENTSGFPPLDQAAVEYARKLSFEPALKDGKHVRAWVRFPVRFEL
jgi:protein TonB